jgi:hypothetical protein
MHVDLPLPLDLYLLAAFNMAVFSFERSTYW